MLHTVQQKIDQEVPPPKKTPISPEGLDAALARFEARRGVAPKAAKPASSFTLTRDHIGQYIPQKGGIFMGVVEPQVKPGQNANFAYYVYAAPTDLPDPQERQAFWTVKEAARRLANFHWYGYSGASELPKIVESIEKTGDNQPFRDALAKGLLDDQWIIPPIYILMEPYGNVGCLPFRHNLFSLRSSQAFTTPIYFSENLPNNNQRSTFTQYISLTVLSEERCRILSTGGRRPDVRRYIYANFASSHLGMTEPLEINEDCTSRGNCRPVRFERVKATDKVLGLS